MSQSKTIFRDKKVQADFEREGFVKIPLLNRAQVDRLLNGYEKNRPEHDKIKAFHHTSTDTADMALIKEEDSLIKETLVTELNKMMESYKPLVGCFHIKEVGTGSATGMHQDPTFVDDNKYMSANVWVALQDINAPNGNLFFIPGSHRVSQSLRVTPGYAPYYASYADKLRNNATEVPLKAGEAVVFYNATIHGATDNRSDRQRLAATLLLCSEEAQWQIYFSDSSQDKPIEKYNLDFEAFIEMPKNGKPSASLLTERLTYEFPIIPEEEFRKRVKQGYEKPGILGWISKNLEIFRK
jgi:hypothetical protein